MKTSIVHYDTGKEKRQNTAEPQKKAKRGNQQNFLGLSKNKRSYNAPNAGLITRAFRWRTERNGRRFSKEAMARTAYPVADTAVTLCQGCSDERPDAYQFCIHQFRNARMLSTNGLMQPSKKHAGITQVFWRLASSIPLHIHPLLPHWNTACERPHRP